MIGSKFFFDSAPLINLVEYNETYYDKISLFVTEAVEQELQLLTSAISIAEFGVKPKKLVNRNIIRHFERTITRLFDILTLTQKSLIFLLRYKQNILLYGEWTPCKLHAQSRRKQIFLLPMIKD